MLEKDYSVAKELKEKLSGAVDLVDFRVFGSRARGDYEEYSDLDVFIEVETLPKQVEEVIHEIVWEVGLAHSLFIAPTIFTRQEIEASPVRVSPIVKNIYDEGIVV